VMVTCFAEPGWAPLVGRSRPVSS